jgi:YD repeat-containing protein
MQPDFVLWSTATGMNGLNLASSATAILVSQSFATTTTSGVSTHTVTDVLSRQTKYRMSGPVVAGITRPGSTSEDVTITYSSSAVASVTTPVGTTNYTRSDAGSARTVTVTDPLSHSSIYVFDITSQRMTSFTDALTHSRTLTHDTSGRLTRVTEHEGNYVQLTRDARGNVTEERHVSKTAGTPADIVTTASYDSSCTNTVTCNLPNWTRDAKSQQTDYSYDASHGGVLTVTAPADPAGVRPQTRYSYTGVQAYYLNGSGSIVASGQTSYRLTGVSTCHSSASCTGTADEAKTTISYGPQTAGVGNNLLPVSITAAAGDNSVTATTAVTYDAVGNATSIDGPQTGADDQTVIKYDALRRSLGAMGPDSDGSGSLPNMASRITYDTRGRVTTAEKGYTSGQSDTAWTGFTMISANVTTYDNADRKLTVQQRNHYNSPVSMMQYSYDGKGRLDCATLRMNSPIYYGPPASACTMGPDIGYGKDRITQYSYDALDRVTSVKSALTLPEESTDVTTLYNVSGTTNYVIDAQNNRTTYEYDAHNRLIKTRFPVPTAGANSSSTTDYEELAYDANGNVTSRRKRDGSVLTFSYDALDRVTVKVVPER